MKTGERDQELFLVVLDNFFWGISLFYSKYNGSQKNPFTDDLKAVRTDL